MITKNDVLGFIAGAIIFVVVVGLVPSLMSGGSFLDPDTYWIGWPGMILAAIIGGGIGSASFHTRSH